MEKSISSVLAVTGLTAFLSFTACSKSSPSTPEPRRETIYVHGDPQEIVKSATLNKHSIFTAKNIGSMDQFSLMSLITFVEKERAKTGGSSKSEIENENKANEGKKDPNEGTELRKLSIKKISDQEWHLGVLKDSFKIVLEADANGELQPVRAYNVPENSTPVEIIHWSSTPDGRFFSLLMKYTDSDSGAGLVAFYFEKTTTGFTTVETTEKQFAYIGGPGVRLRWKIPAGEALEVRLCGDYEETSIAEAAIQKWQVALGDRLKMNVVRAPKYAPFSDLNEHCIYVVDKYTTESREEVANYGATFHATSDRQGFFVDSDIFIYRAEFRKVLKYLAAKGYDEKSSVFTSWLSRHMEITFLHEFGHLIGLDHKFDGTKSVMSYELDSTVLLDYDIKAIQALYAPTPLRP